MMYLIAKKSTWFLVQDLGTKDYISLSFPFILFQSEILPQSFLVHDLDIFEKYKILISLEFLSILLYSSFLNIKVRWCTFGRNVTAVMPRSSQGIWSGAQWVCATPRDVNFHHCLRGVHAACIKPQSYNFPSVTRKYSAGGPLRPLYYTIPHQTLSTSFILYWRFLTKQLPWCLLTVTF